LNYSVTTHRYGQPAHDVRSGGDKNALEYVTVHRPTEHTGGGGAGFKKGDYAAAVAGQNGKVGSSDAMGVCMFPGGHWAGKTVDLIKAATGWNDFKEEDIALVGAREFALARLFDLTTMALTDPKKEWDMLVPHRWFYDPTPTGPLVGKVAYEGNPDKLFNEALPAGRHGVGQKTRASRPSTPSSRSVLTISPLTWRKSISKIGQL
jgi:aldehyde:ferredoxin oxidoreductase